MVPHVVATVKASDGAVIANPAVSWASSNEAVASAVSSCNPSAKTCNQASIIAVGNGMSTITATSDGVSTNWTLSVVMNPVAADFAAIDMFEIVEYGSSPAWYYAPLVRVTERTGVRSVYVVGMELSVPGLGQFKFCGGRMHVGHGQSVEFFRPTSYGDFDVTFYRQDGGRASGQPFVTLYVANEAGTVGKVEAAGSIRAGSLPAPAPGEVTGEERGDSC
jgi:hypothetical protein